MRGLRSRSRELGALSGALTVTLGLVVCGASSASAGEDEAASGVRAQGPDVPDVAMIVAGGTGQTEVVRSGQPAFARLRHLLRPAYTGTERGPQAWTDGRCPPVAITVVWGLTGVGGWPQTDRAPGGDVAVERQDQLFVAGDGTPWIRTDPAPAVQDDDIRWHRAPRSVFVQLEREKVLSRKVLSGLGDGASGAQPGADGTSGGGTTSQRLTVGEAGHDRGSVWWAVPGLAVGLAAGAGGTSLIRRAAARQGAGPPREEPRQELIDL
ncbi:hypothetical protein ABZT17_02245 [Streptomyces sp. NPDC005648]|uniref:hypothetical protein n=1 Tax=Streptomyces sp. NPDC005648 TaxID=3157044 RepID=UPI0033A50E8A